MCRENLETRSWRCGHRSDPNTAVDQGVPPPARIKENNGLLHNMHHQAQDSQCVVLNG